MVMDRKQCKNECILQKEKYKCANVTITNSAGGITIASSNPGGTVTSVSGTSPVSVANGTTTPTVSLAAGYGDTLNPYAAKTATHVLAGPTSGVDAVPSFRALATTDIPTLNQNTTGTAAGLSTTLATTSGGTGLTSFTANGVVYASSTSALTTGSVLTFNGTTLGVIGDTSVSSRRITVGTSYSWPATTFAVVDFGLGSVYEQNAQDVVLSNNVRYSSIFQTVYKAAAAASQYKQVGGVHYWSSNTTVGSAGANLTLTDQMTLNDSGLSVAKGIITRVNSQTTTASPWAWDSTLYDQQQFTALANALTINADAGTPANGQQTTFRFTDNGTAQALTWTTGTSKSFRALGTPLPTTTVASKTLYVGCIYNSTAARWDVVAVAQET